MKQGTPTSRRRAMTAAELIVAMAMTALVLAALGAAWHATGQAWKFSGGAQVASITGAQAAARLENFLRESKYVFQCGASGAAGAALNPTVVANASGRVFVWKSDNWNGAADGAVQLAELALLEHDSSTSRIVIYQAIPQATMTASQQIRAGGIATWADLCNTATPDIFKSYDFVTKAVVAEAITSAAFDVPAAPPYSRPIIEYTMTLSRAGEKIPMYGSVALRGPTTRPQ